MQSPGGAGCEPRTPWPGLPVWIRWESWPAQGRPDHRSHAGRTLPAYPQKHSEKADQTRRFQNDATAALLVCILMLLCFTIYSTIIEPCPCTQGVPPVLEAWPPSCQAGWTGVAGHQRGCRVVGATHEAGLALTAGGKASVASSCGTFAMLYREPGLLLSKKVDRTLTWLVHLEWERVAGADFHGCTKKSCGGSSLSEGLASYVSSEPCPPRFQIPPACSCTRHRTVSKLSRNSRGEGSHRKGSLPS